MDTHPNAADYLLRSTGCAEAQNHVDRERERAALEGDAVAYYVLAESKGEAPGRWGGKVAEAFGVMPGDKANPNDVRALLGELKNPRTGEYLGKPPKNYRGFEQIMAERLKGCPADQLAEERRRLFNEVKTQSRRAVGFFDATFSAPKGVSIYEAALRAQGEHEKAEQVRQAHRDAIDASMRYLNDNGCWTRRGAHRQVGGRSVGRFERGQGFAEVRFDHSTSRAEDPHLHTHVAIPNKTLGADGTWVAVHNRTFNQDKPIAAAIYEAELAARVEAIGDVRFATTADGLSRDVIGLSEEDIAESSQRTRDTLAEQARMVAAFEQEQGRAPTQAERRELHRQAGLQSRSRKSEATPEQQLAQWARRDEVEPGRMLTDMRGARVEADRHRDQQRSVDTGEVVRQALAEVQAASATWTRGELIARLSNQLALSQVDGGEAVCVARAETLADAALARDGEYGVVELTRPDPGRVPDWWRHAPGGPSVFRDPAGGKFALAEHLSTERRLVADAARSGARTLPADALREIEAELLAAARPLDEQQRTAVLGVLGSGRAADQIVAPAGTGKSHTAGTLARLWGQHHRGRVIGVATSQRAAEVLSEDGISSLNSTQFLRQYDPGSDAAVGTSSDTAGGLTNRDLLVVDEANMSSTAELWRIQRVAARTGAKLVYQGDPAQLSAVGAGGILAELETQNGAYTLGTAHRFAADWERDASLRLRDGDTDALDAYEDHGRIRGGTSADIRDEAVLGYVADTLRGLESVLVVGTNDEAAEVSWAVQARLHEVGRVGASDLAALRDGNTLRAGDVVQARQNNYRLAGGGVTNRELLEVVSAGPDGSVQARRRGREPGEAAQLVELPASYVGEHLTLGYAGTEHAVEGLSVDTAHALHPGYVAMTRGKHSNILYVETQRAGTAEEKRLDTNTRAVAEAAFTREAQDASALQQYRDELAASRDLAAVAHLFELTQGENAADRHAEIAAYHVGATYAENLLRVDERGRTDRSDGFAGLLRSMRRAELRGHDAEALLEQAIGQKELSGVADLGRVLRARFDRVERDTTPGTSSGAWAERGERIEGPRGEFEGELAALMDSEAERLGEQAVRESPGWATETVGPVPDDPLARVEWQRKAGVVAAYRQAQRVPDQQVSLGAPPNADEVVARVLFEQAASVTVRPQDALDYRQASDAELRAVMGQWQREQGWAPYYAAHEQGRAHEAAQRQHAEAVVLAEQGEAEQADRAQRIADRMEHRAAWLDEAAEVRARWEAHTAAARDAARAAEDEVARRRGKTPAAGLDDPQLGLFTEPEPTGERVTERLGEADGAQPSLLPGRGRDQQPEVDTEVGGEVPVEVEGQVGLFTAEATPAQQARHERGELGEGHEAGLEPTVEADEQARLDGWLRRAQAAAEILRQRTEARKAAAESEAARTERFARHDERQAEREQATVRRVEAQADEGLSL